jgi:ABC-2 type transport system ATP-binding protein
MSTPSIEVLGLHLRYGKEPALQDVTFTLPGDRIYGLLGRNGSGKTTLLSVLAGFRRPSAGTVRLGGEDTFEHPRVMREIAFVSSDLASSSSSDDTDRIRDKIRLAARLRPRWDAGFADDLLRRFELEPRKKVAALSRGQRAALAVVIGLASRAPVTLFDEAHLGMDAPSRYAFYDTLLQDYTAHPRTVIISTHHIDEVARLFEAVVILDRGQVLLLEDTDALRAQGAAITGPAQLVDETLGGLEPLSEQRLGDTKAAVVWGPQINGVRERARAAGLELGPVPLQDLFVHLTARPREDRPS